MKNKTILLTILVLSLFSMLLTKKVFADGGPTKCAGTVVPIFPAVKKLLPLPSENNCSTTVTGTCGRTTKCVKPMRIVMHTTWGITSADGTYQYFANGTNRSGIRYGFGTHFSIGTDGRVLQMSETLSDSVEITYGTANYSDHISIEMGSVGDYDGKAAMSPAQYQAALSLVKNLMKQYNIPLGNMEFDWKSPSNAFNPNAGMGVFGHYQLNPETKSDPGINWMKDFRADLKAGGAATGGGGTGPGTGTSKCVMTKVGNPATSPTIPPECQ